MVNNSVKLVGYYGSDEIIACSAWISTSNELTDEKKARIDKMIDNLWMNGHETPFEKGIIHFIVNSEIASHIHLLKHRIASINGESARYKELKEDKYYLPEDWKEINIKNSIGYYSGGKINAKINWENCEYNDLLKWYTDLGNFIYHQAINDIGMILGKKRAKESARFFKTYNSQIEVDIMFNMRSFANFLKVRGDKNAQKEIRDIANKMLKLVEDIEGNPFKYTIETFKKRIEYGKITKNNTRIQKEIPDTNY